MNDSELSTRLSLILRLKADRPDQSAWTEFIHRYGGKIHRWCLQRRLQQSDAEDVTQTVLLKLITAIRNFEYNPAMTFRGWLRTITENAVRDFFRDGNERKSGKGGSSIFVGLDTAEAPADLAAQLEAAFDLELFEQAMQNVKSRITEHRWLAWELTARERLKAQEVAQRLKMKIANVYTAKNQVQTMIRDEIATLEQNPLPASFNAIP